MNAFDLISCLGVSVSFVLTIVVIARNMTRQTGQFRRAFGWMGVAQAILILALLAMHTDGGLRAGIAHDMRTGMYVDRGAVQAMFTCMFLGVAAFLQVCYCLGTSPDPKKVVATAR